MWPTLLRWIARRPPVAAPPATAEPLWLAVALAELQAHLEPGTDRGACLRAYLSAVEPPAVLLADAPAWSSAFVNWCLRRAGVVGTGSPVARAWLQWGLPLRAPRRGCITILTGPGGVTWQGRAGFYLCASHGGRPEILGGHHTDHVSIATVEPGAVLAYRWPLGGG